MEHLLSLERCLYSLFNITLSLEAEDPQSNEILAATHTAAEPNNL